MNFYKPKKKNQSIKTKIFKDLKAKNKICKNCKKVKIKLFN